jgi:hypothetical protein
MTDQVSHLCETAGTVTVLYILIFIILDSKWADKRFWHITELGTVSRQAQWEVYHIKKSKQSSSLLGLFPQGLRRQVQG